MSTVRVLCVENHIEYLDALKYMLETAGYEVVSATTGNQGLSMLTSQSIQGVLLEYELPDATGSSVRTEMKRIKPDVPVLLFAGVGSQTPFLLRFFDAYLRNAERPEWAFHDLDQTDQSTTPSTETQSQCSRSECNDCGAQHEERNDGADRH
jgi:CheY-like chemotaxis protein